MRFLLVLAHPLEDSYAAAVADTARQALLSMGHEVDWLDLYREDFDPRLTASERRSYVGATYDASGVHDIVSRLQAAHGLILVFPQWWFNVPAILKGFFDRVLVPDVAFRPDHAGGRLVPQLTNIRHFWALTTTGSPWWIVHLYMGNPVRRLLKRGITNFCAKRMRYRMLTLHDMDRTTDAKRTAHLRRVHKAIASIQ